MVTMTRDEALSLLAVVTDHRPKDIDEAWRLDRAYFLLIERMKQDPDAPSVDD